MKPYGLVDIGSTRIKWQLRDGQGRVRADGVVQTVADCVQALTLERGPEGVPHAVWLARVGDAQREQALCTALIARLPGLRVIPVRVEEWVEGQGRLGVTSKYARGQLGVDRFCALVAARAVTSGAYILVDAGTAITVDLMNVRGEHQGGYLFPGRQLGWDALQAPLSDRVPPRVPAAWPESLPQTPGLSSEQGLERGLVLGLAGAVDRLIAQSRVCLGADTTCWLHGGDAGWLAPLLHEPVQRRDNLVLEGLAHIAVREQNPCAG